MYVFGTGMPGKGTGYSGKAVETVGKSSPGATGMPLKLLIGKAINDKE
jgi:hypothetical protein